MYSRSGGAGRGAGRVCRTSCRLYGSAAEERNEPGRGKGRSSAADGGSGESRMSDGPYLPDECRLEDGCLDGSMRTSDRLLCPVYADSILWGRAEK